MMARSLLRQSRAIGLLILVPALLCHSQPGPAVGWGTTTPFGRQEPKTGDEYMAVCAGGYHCLALTVDGKLIAWGENSNGQCTTPFGNNFVAISAGLYHNLALRSDGTVVAWGDNARGQSSVPLRTKFLAVGAGFWHSLGVRTDGTLVAWGWNQYGQRDVPPGRDYTEVAGGLYHSLALKTDRSLVAWGGNDDGQSTVPPGNDFVHIAAGGMHSLALKADGTIVAWGRNNEGQCNAPAGNDFVGIAGGAFHSLALHADGRVEAWGQNDSTQCDVPAVGNLAAVSAGKFHSLALQNDRAGNPPVVQPKPPTAKPLVTTTEQKDTTETRTNPSAPKLVPTLTANESASPRLTGPDKPDKTQVQAPPTPTVDSGTTPPSKDNAVDTAKPKVKPDTKPAQTPTTSVPNVRPSASEKGKPAAASATDPNNPLNQNDPVRQGLAANLYLDASDHAVPVYHFTSVASPGNGAPGFKQHFCTIDEAEKYKLIDTQSKVWKYEGIAFFAYPEGQQPPDARPIYRFWSESQNRYFFTMDEALKKTLVEKLDFTWKYQGIAWYAPAAKPK